MKWTELGRDSHQLEDSDGLIRGKVVRCATPDDHLFRAIYSIPNHMFGVAAYTDITLGQYVSVTHAKNAVNEATK